MVRVRPRIFDVRMDLSYSTQLSTQANMFNPTSMDRDLKVRRIGISRGYFADFYHWVMAAAWWQLILAAGIFYMCINASFATLYYLGGDTILNARPKSFVDAFIFSFQTSTTIGYGYLLPKTPYAHFIVMFDAIVGILYVAVVTGLAFAKFARPRPRVLFSDRALVVDYEDGYKALVFSGRERTLNPNR